MRRQESADNSIWSRIAEQRTALMGVAALWVYYFHVLPVGRFEGTLLQEAEWLIHRIGFCGVDIFMLLSAYGLYHGFRKAPVHSVADYLHYLGRRLLRIYPVIVPVAVLIALADNRPLRSLIPRLTFYEAFSVNLYKFLWFVPCVLVLYLIAPFYDRLLQRLLHGSREERQSGTDDSSYGLRAVFLLTVGVSLIAIVVMFLLRNTLRVDLYALVTRIPVFLLGFYFGVLADRSVKPDKGTGAMSAFVLVLGFLSAYAVNKQIVPMLFPSMNVMCNLLIAPSLVLLLTQLFEICARNRVCALLPRFFAFFGTVSLEFYALQEWVWSKIEPLRINMGRRQVLCFLIVITGAYGLHALAARLHNRQTS